MRDGTDSRVPAEKNPAAGERERALLEAAPFAIVIMDRAGVVTDCNSQAQDLMGHSRERAVGMLFEQCIDDRDRLQARRHLDAILAGAPPETALLRLMRQDGSSIEAEITASPIRDTAGGVSGILLSVRPVSVIAAAAMALLQREEEFRLVFEENTDAIFWADVKTGIIIKCNRQAETLLGRRRDEIIGTHQSQLHPPAIAEETRELFASVASSPVTRYVETDIITSTGVWVPVSITTSVVTVGERTIIQGIFHDITERRRTERDLAKRTSMLAALIETIPNPIFYKDVHGRYTGCNRAYEQLMGISRDQLVGKTVYDIAPPGIARVYEAKDRELFDNPGHQQYEWKIARPDGTERDVVFYKATVLDEQGAVEGLIGVILDITELRAFERNQQRELAITAAINRLYRPLIAHNLTIEDIARIILDEAKGLTESAHGFAGTIDRQSGDIAVHTLSEATGDDCLIEGYRDENRLIFHHGADGTYDSLWGHALNTRQGFYTNDPAAHTASRGVPSGHIPIGNFLAIPVELDGVVEGMIALANASRDYHPGDLEAVNRIGDYFALAIRRIRDEAALRQSEEKFRVLFENSKVGIALADLTGRLMTVNQALCDMTEYTSAELTANDFRILTHPDYLPAEEVLLAEVVQGARDSYSMEKRYITKTGRVIWVSLTVSVIKAPDGSPYRLAAVVEEITLRKEAEERFRVTFEQAAVGIALVNTDGRWIRVNQKLCDILGYTAEELTRLTFHELTHPEDLDDNLSVFRRLLTGELPHFTFEKKYLRKDGAVVNVNLYTSVVTDSSGMPEYFITVIEDITGRKALERSLIDAKLAAENASRAKSSFLANMSHELRTPLNAILGFTQILERQDTEHYTDKQRSYLSHILDSGRQLLEMVNDILDLSRIEAGREELTKRPFNLALMLSRSPASIKSLAQEKNITLEIAVDPAIGWLNGDEMRLKQVVHNLLSNALTYTQGGRRIGLEARPEGDSAIITVWDEGIGIPESLINSIFDPFEQVSTGGRGAGLGLAISKRLVELHGGTILVTSHPGAGSRFTLILPGRSDNADGTRRAGADGHDTIAATRHRILVVEDNPLNMTLITEALKLMGYEPTGATTGRTALALAGQERFDLVLLDIQLPDLDGISVLGELRAVHGRALPVIAVTAFAMKGDRERYLEAGFDEYIAKPIDLDAFKRTIAAVLGRHTER